MNIDIVYGFEGKPKLYYIKFIPKFSPTQASSGDGRDDTFTNGRKFKIHMHHVQELHRLIIDF